jgi:hypothetical protein
MGEPSKEYMDKHISQFPNSYFEGITNAFIASKVFPVVKDIENAAFPIVGWDNENIEKSITIDATNKNILYINVTKTINTTFKVEILNAEKSTYNEVFITDLHTGVNSKRISSVGFYQVDVADVTSVRITSVISSIGANSSLTYIFDKMPRIPHQINVENKTFTPAVLERSVSTVLQEVSKGVIYTSSSAVLRKSTDWGMTFTDVHTFSANIKRVAVLENGNILVLLTNGELHISQNSGATFTINDTFPATSAKLPHDLFGITYYKNIVLMVPYAQIPSGDPGMEVYMSTDSGVNFSRIFNLLNYTEIPNSMKHVHSATYDPWENMIWVCTGDGATAQMVFYSKDMGVTWFKAKKQGFLEHQSTVIIPLKDCVLFTSDARLVGVSRYIRPTTGTIAGSELHFDMPFILAEKWGKDVASEVPIGSTAVIDYENSVAYFGWGVVPSAFTGRVNDALNYGEVYTTDGFNFKLAYKRSTVTQQSSYGIFGDLSHSKKIAAKLVHVGHVCDVLDVTNVWK